MEKFAVVLPYYNEADFIVDTLKSLLAQSHPVDQLILVDNGSTDGSEALCRRVLAGQNIREVRFLQEGRPGQTHALEFGALHVRREFLMFADADTYYPPHYLANCARLFRQAEPGCVGVMAKDVRAPHHCWNSWLARWIFTGLAKILPGHCFAGCAGHVFRTAAYRAAGGYSSARWDYVLQDHELVHRIHKIGPTIYHPDQWCIPSPRRGDRSDVSWNKLEQLIYFLTPGSRHTWFYHQLLASRFEKRRMNQLNLREQCWQATLPVAANALAMAETTAAA